MHNGVSNYKLGVLGVLELSCYIHTAFLLTTPFFLLSFNYPYEPFKVFTDNA